jgi:hypothetical protein
MKTFLAMYTGGKESPNWKAWEALSPEEKKTREKTAMEAWNRWVQDKGDAIVGLGAPLGKTKRVDASGVGDTRNELCAYTLVRAESHEAAAELFVDHPHFTLFPGDAVEIMECLPLPNAASEG